MSPTIRASAVFAACVAVIGIAPPAVADPGDPIPGNGVFRVGPDIEPGLYRTGGTASTWGVWINNIPTQDEMCSWFTYSTPDANKENVVQANSSMGPMYATINTTIKAVESKTCLRWRRVKWAGLDCGRRHPSPARSGKWFVEACDPRKRVT